MSGEQRSSGASEPTTTPGAEVTDRNGNVWRRGVNRWHLVTYEHGVQYARSWSFLVRDYGPITPSAPSGDPR